LIGVGAGYDLICQITPRFDPPRKLTEIKQEVALVSGEMNQVKKDIFATTEKVGGLTTNVGGLTTKVGGLTTEVRIATLVALAAILIAVLAFYEGLSGWERVAGLIATLVVVVAVGFILRRLKI
jgi:hypothetical protein